MLPITYIVLVHDATDTHICVHLYGNRSVIQQNLDAEIAANLVLPTITLQPS